MKRSFYFQSLIVCALVFLAGCRTDQPLFANAVYTGLFALGGAVVGIIYVMKKLL
jgi:hypothetical protein